MYQSWEFRPVVQFACREVETVGIAAKTNLKAPMDKWLRFALTTQGFRTTKVQLLGKECSVLLGVLLNWSPRAIRVEALHLPEFVEASWPEILLINDALMADNERFQGGLAILGGRSR